MPTGDDLKLRLVTQDDAKAVKNFVREFFLESEPLHEHLFNKECKDFRYFYRANNVGECINEGLSYIYINETGEIAALGLVGYKIRGPSGEYVTPIEYKLKPFYNMIEAEVEPIVNLRHTDKEASFRMLSVHPDWIGKGLAKLLVEKVMTSLKSLGFTHIRTFGTSAYSTKLFEKFGFKKVYSIKYADYTPNGEVVFLPGEPHTHLNYMHIKL